MTYGQFSPEYTAKDDSTHLSSLIPLYLYSLRWNIEVMFYEIKSFWSFGNYMLRTKIGIENFVNLLSISYTCAKLMPFADSFFPTSLISGHKPLNMLLVKPFARNYFSRSSSILSKPIVFLWRIYTISIFWTSPSLLFRLFFVFWWYYYITK